MTARSRVLQISSRAASVATFTVASALAAYATNPITVFPHVNVRLSSNGAGYGDSQAIISSSTLNLNCPASGIKAHVSSTRDGKGNVLVDNFIDLTVSLPGANPPAPVNICHGGIVENGSQQDCFTSGYQIPASNGQLKGQNPDSLAATGGIPPIDIASFLSPGLNQVKLDLVDTGGYVASSSIYLYTSCKLAGVSGPSMIGGNPIPAIDPPPSALTQNFTFNNGGDQKVQQTLDLSFAETANSLTITDGTIPTVTDIGIDPATWQRNYVKGTSFATSQCLIHTGESFNGSPACKLYTVTCQSGQNAVGTGAQCPISTLRNEVFEDYFDGPAFTLPDIHAGGTTFHQGIGYLMASEGWTGGACSFDPASDLQNDLCPLNLLTQFTGPGAYGSKGTTNHPNSAFVTVAPVPEDLTAIYIAGENGKWINSHSITATFSSIPPVVPTPNNGFVAAPIASITYGISAPDALPSTEFPVPTDTVLANVPCPTPAELSKTPANHFRPADQTISLPEDGAYLIHYFATDCAGTQELLFTQDTGGSWSTSFYTKVVNVDTVPPVVVAGPVLTPAPTLIHGVLGYGIGQHVVAHYQCSDDASGVAKCGSVSYSIPVTNPGSISTTVDTSTPGTKTFKVAVTDYAQNPGTTEQVAYTVVAP